MFFVPPIPPINSALDYIILSYIATLLLLSLLSLSFIFYLCLRCRSSRHLQRFNSLWAVRFLLTLFITLWSINELLGIPYFRWLHLFPFLPHLSLPLQASLCKTHLVLSIGFLEPGFLVTLLFLLKVSVKKPTPKFSRALVFVFSSCLPVVTLQMFFIAFPRFEVQLPEIFHQSSVVVRNPYGDETVQCEFPLMGTFVFAAFATVYAVFFVCSCWKLMSLVINKALRNRIYMIAAAVLATLPLEIFFLVLSVLWTPDRCWHRFAALAVFLSTFFVAAVGESVLVIKPISDSLAAGGEFVDDGRLRSCEETAV